MSNQLSILNYQNHQVQSVIKNGEIFFRATQLAELLEYQNPHDAIKKHVDIDDLAKCEVIDSLGRKQKINFVNESGMYSLILSSKQESAQKVKKWVTSEILPSIRKTGSYSLTINEEQKYLIKKAVNERVYRTGEKHQTIYHKLYDQFRIKSYENLPSSKIEDAIKFLGGVHVNSAQFTDDELCTLAWSYKAAERMRQHIKLVTDAMYQIKSEYAPSFYSMGVEYARTLENARKLIDRETRHITIEKQGYLSNNWVNVLPNIRQIPRIND